VETRDEQIDQAPDLNALAVPSRSMCSAGDGTAQALRGRRWHRYFDMHPYWQWRAKLAAGQPDTAASTSGQITPAVVSSLKEKQ